MASKTKRQITIETHSITIIRTKENSNSVFCEHCQRNVTAFSVEQIANFFEMDLGEVCRQIKSGELHLTNGTKIALVCSVSLDNRKNLREENL